MTFLQWRRKHSFKVRSDLNINVVILQMLQMLHLRRTVLQVLSVCVDFLQAGREIYRNSVPRMYQDGFQFEIWQFMV